MTYVKVKILHQIKNKTYAVFLLILETNNTFVSFATTFISETKTVTGLRLILRLISTGIACTLIFATKAFSATTNDKNRKRKES